jgi:ADP-dependent NAD(P)H-hydrate dehydratase / NAD(P)H-hydrate epimerase
MILLDAAESRELDRLSQHRFGIPSYALMTRAGEAVARAALAHRPDAVSGGVTIIAGKGNNGGDGLVAARKLRQLGVATEVVMLAPAAGLKGDAARACGEYQASGGALGELAEDAALPEFNFGVVIDAVFGTGLNAPIGGLPARVIEHINRREIPTIAVDIASGVNADSGAIMGIAIRAERTVTFGCAKYGHVSYPGAEFSGEVQVEDIGFAPDALRIVKPHGCLFERDDAALLLHPRPAASHKGSYGHLLIIAGSRGKGGAAVLAARGALRSGAGLVTAAIPDDIASIVAGAQAELMTEAMPARDGHFDAAPTIERLSSLLEGKSAIAVGPGLGVSNDTQRLLDWLIRHGAHPMRPLLIDADGLNAVAAIGAPVLKDAAGPVVLTPHPGEMARLLGCDISTVNADRIGAARRLMMLTGAHVLLKGAHSVIATPAGEIAINSSGNPGMATGGMGDVLSGIVGALMGQHFTPGDALKLGVFMHGHAADRLARSKGRFGYLAGDLALELPAAFTEIGYGVDPLNH